MRFALDNDGVPACVTWISDASTAAVMFRKFLCCVLNLIQSSPIWHYRNILNREWVNNSEHSSCFYSCHESFSQEKPPRKRDDFTTRRTLKSPAGLVSSYLFSKLIIAVKIKGLPIKMYLSVKRCDNQNSYHNYQKQNVTTNTTKNTLPKRMRFSFFFSSH